MNEEKLKNENLKRIFRNSGVTRAALFGSRARGDAKTNSDYDFLIEMEPRRTLFDLGGLKMDLEEALEAPVDLVEYVTVHPKLRDQILSEQVVIFLKSCPDALNGGFFIASAFC